MCVLLLGRLALLITLSLCLFNTLNSVAETVPLTSSGPTALVRWIIACLMFVLAALLEYAVIFACQYKSQAAIVAPCVKARTKPDADIHRLHPLDKVMVVLFPLTFGATTLLMWTVNYESPTIWSY